VYFVIGGGCVNVADTLECPWFDRKQKVEEVEESSGAPALAARFLGTG
jgi:hypothetical protein